MKLNRHWLVALGLGLALAACGKGKQKAPEGGAEAEGAEAEGSDPEAPAEDEPTNEDDEAGSEEGSDEGGGEGEAPSDDEGDGGDATGDPIADPAEQARLAREKRTERLARRQGVAERLPDTLPGLPTAPPPRPAAMPQLAPRPANPAPAPAVAAPAPTTPAPPPPAAPPTTPTRRPGTEAPELDRLLPLAEAVSLSGAKSLKPGAPISGLAAVDGYGSVHYATARGDFGVALQVWRDETPRDAEDRYRRLRMQHPGAEDVSVFTPLRGFYSGYGPIQSLTVGKPDKRLVATVSCAEKVCDHATLLKIARAVEARL